MPDIGFGVSIKGRLLEALRAIPPDYQAFIRSGFADLRDLGPELRNIVFEKLRSAPAYPSNLELEPLVAQLGSEPGETRAILAAARLILGIVAYRDDSPQDVVSAAVEAGVLEQNDAAAILELATDWARDRRELRKSLDESSLQHALLPSLSRIELRVDIRLAFSEGKISSAVPVALVYIDTDATDAQLWFQMSMSQVAALESKLAEIRKQLASASEAAGKLI